MSRPIHFRAWSTKGHCWLNAEEHYLAMSGRGVVYNYEDLGCGVLGSDIGDQDVLLEQFTGLKDRDGVDIYEGDIIHSTNVSYEPTAVVVYVDYEARFAPCEIEAYLTGTRDGDLFNQSGEPWLLSECGVIGNIHESPHLLKP